MKWKILENQVDRDRVIVCGLFAASLTISITGLWLIGYFIAAVLCQ